MILRPFQKKRLSVKYCTFSKKIHVYRLILIMITLLAVGAHNGTKYCVWSENKNLCQSSWFIIMFSSLGFLIIGGFRELERLVLPLWPGDEQDGLESILVCLTKYPENAKRTRVHIGLAHKISRTLIVFCMACLRYWFMARGSRDHRPGLLEPWAMTH